MLVKLQDITTQITITGLANSPDTLWWTTSVVILITGTMFVMWLGEKITDRGIGNGISLLIMLVIIAHIPSVLMQEDTKS